MIVGSIQSTVLFQEIPKVIPHHAPLHMTYEVGVDIFWNTTFWQGSIISLQYYISEWAKLTKSRTVIGCLSRQGGAILPAQDYPSCL